MTEVEQLSHLMQAEHAKVMHSLGTIEATLEAVKESQAALAEDLSETKTRLSTLTAEVRNYRSYFLGFMAASSLITSGIWLLFTEFRR